MKRQHYNLWMVLSLTYEYSFTCVDYSLHDLERFTKKTAC